MRYSLTLRTYDPTDCTSVGHHIRANRTTVRVASRSCWRGSRERVWLLRCPNGDGLDYARRIAAHTIREDGLTLEEAYGLSPESADYVGPPIR
jgi:hypothetical protein